MKRKRYTEEQIISTRKQHDSEVPPFALSPGTVTAPTQLVDGTIQLRYPRLTRILIRMDEVDRPALRRPVLFFPFHTCYFTWVAQNDSYQTNPIFFSMPSLNVIHGVQSGVHFELTNRPLSIGRESARDIQITDPKVSRRHATVRFEDGAYVIANVGGKNGIRINGLLIEEKAKLTNGDEITLGDTVLKYEDASDPDRTNYVNEVKATSRNDQTIVQDPKRPE